MKCESCVKEKNEIVNISRFIDKLDSYFSTNDLKGAKEHLLYWEKEARKLHDDKGLLSILNEEIGYSRKVNDKEMAIAACKEAKELIENNELITSVSGAIICINIATTLNAFDLASEGLPLYDIASNVLVSFNKQNSYEYASLLNNKSTCLSSLNRYEEANKCIYKAIEILISEGKHDGEIAISYINLANNYFDINNEDYEHIEASLDKAWEYINSNRQPHDGNYAYILSKCAPSFRFFKREVEALALEEISKEIYGEKR